MNKIEVDSIDNILFDPDDQFDFITEEYCVEDLLGKGAFAKVLKCRKKQSNQLVAIKVKENITILRQSTRIQSKSILSIFQKEKLIYQVRWTIPTLFISSMQFFVKLNFKCRESRNKFYIIMEFLVGQSLTNFKNEMISTIDIIQIIHQVATALQYIHSKGIVHRDLKPDNIIIQRNQSLEVKLIDFGLSYKKNLSNIRSNQVCGTLLYMAPESTGLQTYNQQVDIWSLGLIQYYLFSGGGHPLWSINETENSFLKKLKNFTHETINFPEQMDPSAKHFFYHTVSKYPENRMTATQILDHPWIKGEHSIISPITIDDFISQFDFQKNFQLYIKGLMLLDFLYRNSSRHTVPIIRFVNELNDETLEKEQVMFQEQSLKLITHSPNSFEQHRQLNSDRQISKIQDANFGINLKKVEMSKLKNQTLKKKTSNQSSFRIKPPLPSNKQLISEFSANSIKESSPRECTPVLSSRGEGTPKVISPLILSPVIINSPKSCKNSQQQIQWGSRKFKYSPQNQNKDEIIEDQNINGEQNKKQTKAGWHRKLAQSQDLMKYTQIVDFELPKITRKSQFQNLSLNNLQQ